MEIRDGEILGNENTMDVSRRITIEHSQTDDNQFEYKPEADNEINKIYFLFNHCNQIFHHKNNYCYKFYCNIVYNKALFPVQ